LDTRVRRKDRCEGDTRNFDDQIAEAHVKERRGDVRLVSLEEVQTCLPWKIAATSDLTQRILLLIDASYSETLRVEVAHHKGGLPIASAGAVKNDQGGRNQDHEWTQEKEARYFRRVSRLNT
jgi:hypothetical protein